MLQVTRVEELWFLDRLVNIQGFFDIEYHSSQRLDIEKACKAEIIHSFGRRTPYHEHTCEHTGMLFNRSLYFSWKFD